MNHDRWESEVKSFYQSLSLNQERKSSILQMRTLLLETRWWKRAAGILVASTLSMFLLSIILFVDRPDRISNLPHSSDNVALLENIGLQESDSGGTQLEKSGSSLPWHHADKKKANLASEKGGRRSCPYKLVAVKVNHDKCGRCKKMGNVFVELQHDLEKRSILFVTFDLSDSSRRVQSVLLSEALGISGALENHTKTGSILLIDPLGHMLEQLDGTADKQYLENRITICLDN